MLQQAGQIATTECAQRRAIVFRHQGILAAGARHDRLMQVPSGREQVRQFRPAHKGRMMAMAPGDLLHGAAEQHHGVGRDETRRRCKRKFALARTKLDLDRSQRQTECEDIPSYDVQRRLHLVVALLGQILIAVREQTDRGG